MAMEMELWRVDDGKPVRLVSTGMPLESQLETLIENDSSLLACVGPPSLYGIVWSRSQPTAGRSHPGNRHVRSRHRTKSANARDGV